MADYEDVRGCRCGEKERILHFFKASPCLQTHWLTTMQQIYGICPRFCIFCNCFSNLRSFVTDAIATSSGDDCIRIFQEVIHNQTVLQIFDVWYLAI